jgi:quercetin dioxygenase-like cupin family protein
MPDPSWFGPCGAFPAPAAPASARVATLAGDVARVRHARFDPDAFGWEDVTARAYKDEPGTERGMAWRGLTRHTLVRAPAAGVAFEVRYFEIAPGGFSSLEKHEHVHVVVAQRGRGRALVGDRVVELAPLDIVETAPLAPHRWVNEGDEPFGFVCTVNGVRDRPRPLDDDEWEALLADPRTAPFVH